MRRLDEGTATYIGRLLVEQMRNLNTAAPSQTIDQLARVWLERNRLFSRRSDESRLRRHVLPMLGQHTSATLRKADVEKWMLRLLEKKKLSRGTVNHCRMLLNRIISDAVKNETWPVRNPVAVVPKLEIPESDADVLTREEARRFIEFTPEKYRPMFALAIYLGPRKGEIFGLRKKDVNLEARLIAFRCSHERPATKTGKKRQQIPIPDELFAFLSKAIACAGRTDLVFPGFGNGGRHSRSFRMPRKVRRILRAAGIKKRLTFHGLRRVCSTLHQEAGCHPWIVSRVLGHSQAGLLEFGSPVENMTGRYTKFSEQFSREGLNKLKLFTK